MFVAALVLAINFAPVPDKGTVTIGLGVVALVALAIFFFRQRRAPSPLFDLHVAARRIFWVAAVGGIIVFGSLMGAMFVGQQFLQNVLGYSTLDAGASILPGGLRAWSSIAPRSAKLVDTRGSRFTLLVGYLLLPARVPHDAAPVEVRDSYWQVGLAYAFDRRRRRLRRHPRLALAYRLGPVRRAGMASGTADLQRDLGGAIIQSIMGALLTAGFATSIAKAIAAAPNKSAITTNVENALTKSFSSAEAVAHQYPQYASAIISAAKSSFVSGSNWAYTAGIIAILFGAALVFFMFPGREEEQRLLGEYEASDAAPGGETASAAPGGETASAAPGGETASAAPGGETASAAPGGETASAAPGGETASAAPGGETAS